MTDDPQLARVIETLSGRFTDRPRDVVEDVVRQAYDELNRTARVKTHLAALTQRRATDRLAQRVP